MTVRQWAARAARTITVHALYYTGFLQLWQAIVLRRKAVVLMYHRVLTAEERRQTASHPAVVVDRETFARHAALLKRRFVVLSLEEFAHHIERRIPFPNSSCVITFDDGWRDNYSNALPILRQHGLPALVFLPAGYIGHRRLFWQEALTHLLVRVVGAVRSNPGRRAEFEAILADAGLAPVLDVSGEDPRPPIIAAVSGQKQLTRPTLEHLIDTLAARLGVRTDELSDTDGFVDWDQVDAMSRHGVAFGGHGIDHLLLTQVTDAQADAEIRGSKHLLDSTFAGTAPTFSYPNGYVTPAIVDRVRAAGFRLGFITRRGFISCTDDPLTLRRLNVHEAVTSSPPMFLARIVGLI